MSRRLRKTGLFLIFVGFCAFLPLPVQARFGHQYDWLLPPWLFLSLVACWWVGIALYLIGRFQYRP
ncbi:MAG: hypothetical protein ABSF29_11555 [Tepidisphaeraceae bacterium]